MYVPCTIGVARGGHDSVRSMVEAEVLAFAEGEFSMRLCTFVRMLLKAATTGPWSGVFESRSIASVMLPCEHEVSSPDRHSAERPEAYLRGPSATTGQSLTRW